MKIDCRGLACPQPVLETKKALGKSADEEILVLLDNAPSKENVRRFAESRGCRVQVTEENGIYRLTIGPSTLTAKGKAAVEAEGGLGEVVVFLDSDSLGRGSEELGKILMRSFLQVLEQSDVNPARVILINSGVKLACEGSEVLEDLRELSNKGTEVISCGTCLDYFGIKKNLAAGRVSNMYEILNTLARAAKVIKI